MRIIAQEGMEYKDRGYCLSFLREGGQAARKTVRFLEGYLYGDPGGRGDS
jgi:hypothetical protein